MAPPLPTITSESNKYVHLTAPTLPPPSAFDVKATLTSQVSHLQSTTATTFATLTPSSFSSSLLTFGTNGCGLTDLEPYLSSSAGGIALSAAPAATTMKRAIGRFYGAAISGDRVYAASDTGIDVFDLKSLASFEGPMAEPMKR